MSTEPALPRILASSTAAPARAGAAWKLAEAGRGLDANLIHLPAGDSIAAHEGPELDVLVHVAAGSGTLSTAEGELPLTAGDVVWLPKLSVRGFTAGAEGMRYLTVHTRKPGLQIGERPDVDPSAAWPREP